MSMCDNIELCAHLAFNNNACAWCNKPKNECNNPTTIPLRYIGSNFSVTHDAIRRLRDRDLASLLSRKKLHLVLDLDHTLVHSKRVQEPSEGGPSRSGRLVKFRPGARDFLEQASRMFDLSVYTMAGRMYAKQVVRELCSEEGGASSRFRFTRVISREHCTRDRRKGLDIVLSHERVVLILDDLVEVWGDDYKSNVIQIRPYKFFDTRGSIDDYMTTSDSLPHDDELAKVLRVLKIVHHVFYDDEGGDYDCKDVRQVLQSVHSLLDASISNY